MRRFLLFGLMFLISNAADFKPRDKGHPKSDQCGCGKTPTLFHTFPLGQPVYGVQPVGNEIYVIRDSTPYIEVYDRNTFKPKRNITVNGLQYPYDMVQSSQSPVSLFIADWSSSGNIISVQVSQKTATTWSVMENALTTLGLAGSNIYTNGNIIVTTSASQKLKKFSRVGNLVKEISIQNISSPRQSIQVAANSYAVCYGYGPPPELHRVCLIDVNGNINRCYGGTSGSGVGQLNIPGRLELYKNGCILVADTGNKRVVLLNKNLEYVRNLISTGLDGPYRLFLDAAKELLFVADNQRDANGIAVSGKVVVFKL